MRHGSLFSGIGGFDLAAEWMGWENVFHCEWNEFGQKVLKHYWPKAESYGDITRTDFTKWRGTIDIITGGFPCQPYSSAGKRRGKDDDRHLWPEMLRAIREIAPSYVVGENVLGLTNWNGGMVFNEVHTNLEAEGYSVQAVVIPAAGKNAPHGRDRVWFIAKNTVCNGCFQFKPEEERTEIREQRDFSTRNSDGFYIPKGNAADTECGGGLQICEDLQSKKPNGTGTISIGSEWNAADSKRYGLEYSEKPRSMGKSKGKARKRASGHFEAESWAKFPTQSPICGGDDGLPTELDGITFPKWRAESVKAYGNAIVPQVAYEIFKAIKRVH